MKVVVTAGEALDHYDWEKFCELKELDEFCIRDGLDPGTTFDLTPTEAESIGVHV